MPNPIDYMGMAKGLLGGLGMNVSGKTITRTNPKTGTVLQYEVLRDHGDGNITVRIIPPQGFPQMPPFTAPANKFDKR